LWWQWVGQIPYAQNPVTDPDGSFAYTDQPANCMFYLAGTWGGDVVRHITVPPGRHLLMPIQNQEWDNVYGFEPLGLEAGKMSVADLRRVLDYIFGYTTNMSASLDGRAVENIERYRSRSPVFTFDPDATIAEFFAYPPGPEYPAVADGYYLVFEPL